jgi:hypothetical protein
MKPHPSGEHEALPGYVDDVSAFDPFMDVGTVDELCARLQPTRGRYRGRVDKCEQAEAQFMALSLNRASGRLTGNCCVDIKPFDTAGEVIAEIEALLGSPGRTRDDCVDAQSLADRINTGDGLCDSGGE